jgi:hypothetical protein
VAILGLAFAIIYPDDAANRSARVRRVLISLVAFWVAFALVDMVASTLLGLLSPAGLISIPIGAAIPTALSAVPLCIAERVAGLFQPRRTLGWVAIALVTGLGWGGFLAAVSTIPYLSRWAALAFFLLPGLAAGIAWIFMVKPDGRSLGKVFE